jgi:hypothetical protein
MLIEQKELYTSIVDSLNFLISLFINSIVVHYIALIRKIVTAHADYLLLLIIGFFKIILYQTIIIMFYIL